VQQSGGIFNTQLTQVRLPDYGRLNGIQNKTAAGLLDKMLARSSSSGAIKNERTPQKAQPAASAA